MSAQAMAEVPLCSTCTRRTEDEIAELRARAHNLTTAAEALAEHAHDLLELVQALAHYLEQHDPEYVDHMDEPDRELWEWVAPLGYDDDGPPDD